MAIEVIVSLLLGVVVAFYYWKRTKYEYFKRLGFLSKEPTFLYGNLKGMGTEFHISHILKKFYEEYKNKAPAHGLYQFLMKPTFVVTDLDVIKEILIKNFDNFRNRGLYYTEDDILSNHLFLIEDESWKTMRSNLSPTFTSGKIKTMFHTVLDISNELIAYITKEGNVVEVKEMLSKFTTDVIGNVAFGLESNSLKDSNSTFRQMGLKFFNFDRRRQFKIFAIMSFESIAKIFKIAVTPKDVSDFFITTIRDTVEYRKKNQIERKDFLDLLMKVKNGDKNLTLNEISSQSFVFWIAGFESSSSTATFCLYFLSIHQDIQDKLRNEIQTTLIKHNNEISYDAMLEMKYLQMVINETLRLYGPVFNLMRKAVNDYKVPNSNLVIPKGGQIFIPIHAIHTDPQYYPEPDKFIPERFSEENMKSKHPMTYLPFGDGPRNCIGIRFGLMQTKISLIRLLTTFKFSPSAKTPIPMVLHYSSVVTTPRDGIHLKVVKLQN